MKLLKSVISFAVLQLGAVALFAQYSTNIPLDSSVKYGTLENGMTYYVLHNEEPKDRASFYFVQNVGAMLEEDAQNGLAHFLEHMAFNGTQHFKGKGIINFLEKHGVGFGGDINAYTAQDETVYNLSNVPVKNPGLVDSCLLVLHDWSGFLSLEEEEIDAERGVIREEWRTRRNSSFRLRSKTNPVLFKGSKYAIRDVIGDLDVINNFEYQTLRDYYKMWYRPDQQAVVVVGDVDAAEMEQKIKDLFSTIPLRENLPERKYFQIPDNAEPLYVQGRDREAQSVSISVLFKKAVDETRDEDYLRGNLMKSIYSSMMNDRFQELLQKNICAGVEMSAGCFPLVRTQDAFYLQVTPKEKRELEAFAQLMEELERVNRYGFTPSELKRSKVQMLRSYESYYKTRDKINNDQWAKQMADHFLKANPMPSIEWEYDFAQKVIEALTLDELNQFARSLITKENSVYMVTGPDQEGVKLPGKEELLQVVEEIKKSDIQAYQDEAGDAPLVKKELTEGKIIKDFTAKETGARTYLLENGAKIVVLPTQYSKDEILFTAFSKGGISKVDLEQIPSANSAKMLSMVSGLGQLDAIQLKKKLSGKLVQLAPELTEFTEGWSGSASPQDLETLLQLVYLSFEAPRFDWNAFENQLSAMKSQLPYIEMDNSKAFKDSIQFTNSNHHPRTLSFGEEYVNRIEFEEAVEAYQDRFTDASDFTFVFVGNINLEKDLPLMTKYLGNISSTHRKETWRDHGKRPAKGIVRNQFERDMQVPKSSVYVGLFGELDYNLKNRVYARVVADLLDKRFLETIRETEGGSYGVSVRATILKFPYEHFQFDIVFDCNPEKQEKLKSIVYEEIQKLMAEGPIKEDLEKIKKNYLKNRLEAEVKNTFWLSVIKQSLVADEAYTNKEGYDKLVSAIDSKKLKHFVRKIFSKMDQTEVVMNPKK